MRKHANSIDAAILDRIRAGAKDYVWTPADFLDLGSRAAVDKALSRNVKSDQLRRAGRGLYHLRCQHPIFGDLAAPDSQADYQAMLGPMFFGVTPTFAEIMAAATAFETTFNATA